MLRKNFAFFYFLHNTQKGDSVFVGFNVYNTAH